MDSSKVGQCRVRPVGAARAVRREVSGMEESDDIHLTGRELEILRLIAAGSTNGEIAERLVLELSTVKWHVKHLYSKLGARDRVHLVLRAQALQLG